MRNDILLACMHSYQVWIERSYPFILSFLLRNNALFLVYDHTVGNSMCVFFQGICLSSKISSMITSVLPTPIPIPVQVITLDRQQSSGKKQGKLLCLIREKLYSTFLFLGGISSDIRSQI